MMKNIAAIIGALLALPAASPAWNYEGHRQVAAIAVDSLPEEFPAFARSESAKERIQFLSGEPDRWRNLRDPELKHMNDPNHYFDMERLAQYDLTPATLPHLRNELLGIIYVDRHRNSEVVAAETKEDPARVYMLMGLLPYSIQEGFLKLKSAFVSRRDMIRRGASSADLAQIEQNIIYVMGVMSHYVGDGAQPLHMTVHHHGWVGENPEGYTTSHRFHRWIDGGFIEAAEITYEGMKDRIQPAAGLWPEQAASAASVFPHIMDFLVETHRQVVPLYQLDKDGKLGLLDPSPEGRLFIEEQLLRGGQFLGNVYYGAFKSAEQVPLFERAWPPPAPPE